MIKLDQIEKKYSDFQLNCSLEVPEGCISALIGLNGAGKSTTFKTILGLVFPDGGSIELFGKQSEKITEKDKEQIGVVLSDSGFSGYLKVEDLIPILRSLYPSFEESAFLEKCQKLELPLNKKIKEFSTGMKAKLKVLVAISHNARLLILDEPTAGLDVLAREQILDMLREYMIPGDRSILISSHISSDLEGFCDDLYLIHNGKILLHEDTDILLSEYGILKVTEEQYQQMEKRYLLKKKKEAFGYCLLTNQKQFYQENAPEFTIEKGTIDELITMMIKGEEL
ncbi:MAG: ABC transporter ATP-binding protein [Lachnospiraceae bacterium]|jgi:ABC-2 type transport system ATP-binding protein|nr:ABC transporter ATP-binding protein [Lachnospiraceae bacterium]